MKQTGRARVSFRTMTYSELEIPFHKRLKIQMLMNNESSSYLMELLKNEHCDFYSDSAKEKWFSGKRIFPEEVREILLKHYNLTPQISTAEKRLYIGLINEFNTLISKPQGGKLSTCEKKRRQTVANEILCECNSSDEMSFYREEMERNYYIDEITKKFVELPMKKQLVLLENFDVHNRIPWIAWEFVKEYACLNQLGRELFNKYAKKTIVNMGHSPNEFFQSQKESLELFKKMSQIQNTTFENDILSMNGALLIQKLLEKMDTVTFDERTYLENMELYSEIKSDEWGIIAFFVEVGETFDPVDESFLSYIQKKADSVIDLLLDDFDSGNNE